MVEFSADELLYSRGGCWNDERNAHHSGTRPAALTRPREMPASQFRSIQARRTWWCAGDDDNVPCVGAQQMYQTLKVRGLPTRLIVYPGQNHGLDVPSYLLHRMRSNLDWFNRWLN